MNMSQSSMYPSAKRATKAKLITNAELLAAKSRCFRLKRSLRTPAKSPKSNDGAARVATMRPTMVASPLVISRTSHGRATISIHSAAA